MQRGLYAALLLTAALLAAGCDNEIDNPTKPGDPAPTTTDTFTGTITVNGAATHTFNTAATGLVTITLTEVTPDPAIAVGLILGTWNSVACQTSLSMDAALQSNQLVGNVSGAGTLCVRIHDTGRMTEALNYKLSVTHP